MRSTSVISPPAVTPGSPPANPRRPSASCEPPSTCGSGEPYADWPDAPFAETERRRLTEVRAGAVAGLLEARLELGRHAEVLPELERLVTDDPLREDWWRLLMLALYRAGRQADALAAGRRVRAVLAEELGAEPGPALRSMEAAILAQDPALELPTGRGAADARRADDGPRSGPARTRASPPTRSADAPLFHGRRASRVEPGRPGWSTHRACRLRAQRRGQVLRRPRRPGPGPGRGALPGSQSWQPVIVTPGRAPVDVLASLTGDAPPARTGPARVRPVRGAVVARDRAGERTAFLDAILGLIDDGIVVRCVVVVRGDHVGRLAEHPAFTERLGATSCWCRR